MYEGAVSLIPKLNSLFEKEFVSVLFGAKKRTESSVVHRKEELPLNDNLTIIRIDTIYSRLLMWGPLLFGRIESVYFS